MIKELARKLLPSTARQKVSALYHEQKLFKAARVLAQAKGMSEVLDEKTFDTLMAAYPVGERMSYDNDSVKNRGDERANEMDLKSSAVVLKPKFSSITTTRST